MADEMITELPVATSVNPSDMVPIVQNGTTKQAAASLLGGGSFLSANTARVDPSGDDGTGTVGDLSKPFLTIQAAITALEAGGPYDAANPAVVLLPTVDSTENVTTSLRFLTFQAAPLQVNNPAIGSLTLTATGTDDIVVAFSHVYVGNITANAATGSVNLWLFSAVITGAVETTGSIYIFSPYNTGAVQSDITCGNGKEIHLSGLVGIPSDFSPPTIHATGGLVEVFNSIISDVSAADSIALYDSRLLSNSSGVVPAVTDTLLNPARMDFSTLPTSEPTEVGKAWIDTMNSNVVKVKL